MTDQTKDLDVRSLDAATDNGLDKSTRETTLVFPEDLDTFTVTTEIKTHIRWVLSIETATMLNVRLNDNDDIVGIKARVPKGHAKLKGKPRKHNNNHEITALGPLWEQ